MQQSIQKNGVPVKKGARELLGEIKKRHIKTGIATSSKRPIVNLYLQSAGLESTFDAIITGDMVANSKPNPEIYLKAAQGLGARPEACMGIEDSIHGIKALRAAGMVSVMVPDIIAYSPDLAPYIDYVCASLKDIIDIIRL